METIVALIVVAGIALMQPGPHYDNKADCVKDAQEVGYVALKDQLGGKEVKIYCANPKDYPGLKNSEVRKLKVEDLVPERNVQKEFK